MKTLRLNAEETRELKEHGHIEIERNGFDIVVETNDCYDCGYCIMVMTPYEDVALAQEETVEAAEFDDRKYHIYDVKTTGKHPVHLVNGGEYITEDMRNFGEYDMGIFYLNQRDYDLLKSNLHPVAISELVD